MTFMKGAVGAGNFSEDVGGFGGPDEGLGIFVVAVDVSSNGQNEFFEIMEDAAPQPVLREIAKEAFHHVQPRRAGGREVQMKARVLIEPALDLGMFMPCVVVADQV